MQIKQRLEDVYKEQIVGCRSSTDWRMQINQIKKGVDQAKIGGCRSSQDLRT
ncbi:hypothetical protein DPMN_097237 [Dreissena polymorpha]|uniref:Uncharacterized protein n=1 Tax=Dreissena polymorpha TaxID=45954 RepID=A0A9D4LBE2_DREPO|nr:hypothetical protein DPMN_097237 [Dreissena polymorpha]